MTASAGSSLPQNSGWQWQVPDGAWTYDLYRSLPEDVRYQVIDGRLVMSPSPSRKHQAVSRNLEFILLSWARTHQTGEVFYAPFDVVLSSSPEEQQFVQPDILFVTRERLDILTDDNVQGAPDLVVEVLSPGNAQQDWKDKKLAYERHGVTHYWLLDPHRHFLQAYRLENGVYREAGRYQEDDVFEPEGFPGLSIPLVKVWE